MARCVSASQIRTSVPRGGDDVFAVSAEDCRIYLTRVGHRGDGVTGLDVEQNDGFFDGVDAEELFSIGSVRQMADKSWDGKLISPCDPMPHPQFPNCDPCCRRGIVNPG